MVVSKGQDPTADGYSAFDGTTPSGRSLREDLNDNRVGHLVVGGLATDYCVRQTVVDAREQGFDVSVVTDAISGVELAQGDTKRALEAMAAAGAQLVSADSLIGAARS